MTVEKTNNHRKKTASKKVDSYIDNDPRLQGKKEKKLSKKFYNKELFRLQIELVKLQE